MRASNVRVETSAVYLRSRRMVGTDLQFSLPSCDEVVPHLFRSSRGTPYACFTGGLLHGELKEIPLALPTDSAPPH